MEITNRMLKEAGITKAEITAWAERVGELGNSEESEACRKHNSRLIAINHIENWELFAYPSKEFAEERWSEYL